MPMTPELRTAYEQALYVVYGSPELVLRVGEPSEALDALMDEEGAESAAFLTAANPRGELQPQRENELSSAALHQALADAGYSCLLGEGRDPKDEWPPEPSVLAIGISRHEAAVIGRSYEQNAFVFIERGKPAELVPLDDQ
jgi:hypothetical protein